jgi:hypothetical protein
MISNAELDRLIAELGRHPLAEGELREVKEASKVTAPHPGPFRAALVRLCSRAWKRKCAVSPPNVHARFVRAEEAGSDERIDEASCKIAAEFASRPLMPKKPLPADGVLASSGRSA